MENQVLSIEQMKKLIELGIDTSKASMLWYPKKAIDVRTGKGYVERHFLAINHINSEHFWDTREGKETYPTFTLLDILKLLPRVIWNEDNCYKIEVGVYGALDCWQIRYSDGESFYYKEFTHKNVLEAAFNMLKWCKQNYYI